jgi:hypothetical protein
MYHLEMYVKSESGRMKLWRKSTWRSFKQRMIPVCFPLPPSHYSLHWHNLGICYIALSETTSHSREAPAIWRQLKCWEVWAREVTNVQEDCKLQAGVTQCKGKARGNWRHSGAHIGWMSHVLQEAQRQFCNWWSQIRSSELNYEISARQKSSKVGSIMGLGNFVVKLRNGRSTCKEWMEQSFLNRLWRSTW